jgi:hypothetical protein
MVIHSQSPKEVEDASTLRNENFDKLAVSPLLAAVWFFPIVSSALRSRRGKSVISSPPCRLAFFFLAGFNNQLCRKSHVLGMNSEWNKKLLLTVVE